MASDQPSEKGILHVVTGTGEFNATGVEQFVKSAGVESAGLGYTVVAIMGPQSSGKSTLLNHLVRAVPPPPPPPAPLLSSCSALLLLRRSLPPPPRAVHRFRTAPWPCMQFGTSFEEMDALTGRSQTTRGIWLARAPKARPRAQAHGSSCKIRVPGTSVLFVVPKRTCPSSHARPLQPALPCAAPCRAQVTAPPTLVLDLEGSDGRERGEDDTSFERQVQGAPGAGVQNDCQLQ